MKKSFAAILALVLAMSLTACGGGSDPEPASSAAAPASSTAPVASSTAPASDAAVDTTSFTPEQLAVAEKFLGMCDQFNSLAETINGDESLKAIPELVATMQALGEGIAVDEQRLLDPANLTEEALAEVATGVELGSTYLTELTAMVANYSGQTAVTIPVTIANNTGADFYGLAMSPANDQQWGGNLLSEPLANGESGATEMTFTQETLVWDLMAVDAEGNTVSFMGLDFTTAPTAGATLVLAAEDGNYVASFAE